MTEERSPSGANDRAIRILITDDHPVVRDGLRAILAGTGLEVVGEAASGPEAAQQAAALRPDVVLMDVRMPGGDGLTATRSVLEAAPDSSVVILTSFEDETYLREAIAQGAAGFVLKGSPRELLVESIRLAHAGGSSFPPNMLTDLVDPAAARPPGTPRAVAGATPPAAPPAPEAPGARPPTAPVTAPHAEPRVIRAAPLVIDAARHDVRVSGRRVDLTYMEFRALWRIALARGEVVPATELYASLWPEESEAERDPHRLVSLVARIRSRLGPDGRRALVTVRRVGYRLATPEVDASDAGAPAPPA